ncbi:MAG: hypothetical protein H6603_04095 [Flavobacteriales bacterium]|nr:hypothetical protein [Flavobacteriales bacterium]
MKFVAEHADVGNLKNPDCVNYYEMQFEAINVSHYLQVFEENTGVASCGLAASLMVRILNENNIDAYTYNFGFENTEATHVVTIVPLSKKLMVFDPYVNYWLTDSLGNGIGLREIFNHQFDTTFDVHYQYDPVQADLNVYSASLKAGNMKELISACKEYATGFVSLNDSIAQKKITRSYLDNRSNECSSLIRNMETQLQAETPFSRFHQAMVFKLNKLSGGTNSELLDAQLDSLVARAELERIDLGF